MNPLPDRVVLVGLVATIGLCFALVLWTVKLQPHPEPQLQWRDSKPWRNGPSAQRDSWQSGPQMIAVAPPLP
jgi:hypothetical protein